MHARFCAPPPSRYSLCNRVALQVIACFAFAVSAAPQTPLTAPSASPLEPSLCDRAQLLAARQLTFRERACWYGSELISPWSAVRAAVSSGFGQWWNDPYLRHEDGDDYNERFAVFYARRTARETGEFIAGYLNHEDPRPHISGETATGKRIRSAILSVLVTRNDEGSSRPALTAVAGSLGSAFAQAASYREQRSTEYALRGASVTYAGYFGKALYQEFRPDISFFVHRVLHKRQN